MDTSTVQDNQESLDIDTEHGTAEEGESITRKTINTVGKILSSLRAAVRSGQITRHQAKSFRRELGITQAFFTRKQMTSAQRKAKRQAQKTARKNNRGKR